VASTERGPVQRTLHAWIGLRSYLLAPQVMIGLPGRRHSGSHDRPRCLTLARLVRLAHSSMQGKSPQGQPVDAYFLYIRVVRAAIFLDTSTLGVSHRRTPEIDSRYMLCTGLPLIDPVVRRITQRLMGSADLDYQLLTFGLACAVLGVLIAAARHADQGRRGLTGVLLAFALSVACRRRLTFIPGAHPGHSGRPSPSSSPLSP
jgi:hypothetical protein